MKVPGGERTIKREIRLERDREKETKIERVRWV